MLARGGTLQTALAQSGRIALRSRGLKKLLITLLKFGVSIALLVYLVRGAAQDNAFEKLRDQPKDWNAFVGAFLLCFLAVVLSIVRWYFLVRALELPFRLRDAFRLGFLGYLLNFFSLGNVGGDLFKAVFIAREQHGRRAEAVATVVVDRVIGLYVLFLVATTAIFWTGLWSSSVREIQVVCRATLICTVVGGVGSWCCCGRGSPTAWPRGVWPNCPAWVRSSSGCCWPCGCIAANPPCCCWPPD